jgi:hypothetical protein
MPRGWVNRRVCRAWRGRKMGPNDRSGNLVGGSPICASLCIRSADPEVGKFSGSPSVASRNRLQPILAAVVANEYAQTATLAVCSGPSPFHPGGTTELATSNFREFGFFSSTRADK